MPTDCGYPSLAAARFATSANPVTKPKPENCCDFPTSWTGASRVVNTETLALIGALTGVVGALTGVASLVWQIITQRQSGRLVKVKAATCCPSDRPPGRPSFTTTTWSASKSSIEVEPR